MAAKTRKQRGLRTHGWGAGKKHRGAGHRGGRGNAGSGKRGQQKKTLYLARGIKNLGIGRKIKPKIAKKRVINVGTLASRLNSWEKKGLVKKEKGQMVVDLRKLGYTKLLGVGDAKDLKGKVNIIINEISSTARTKLGLKVEANEGGEA